MIDSYFVGNEEQEGKLLKCGNNMVGYEDTSHSFSWLAVFSERGKIDLYCASSLFNDLSSIVDGEGTYLIGTFTVNAE